MNKRLTLLAAAAAIATVASAASAQSLRAPTYYPAAAPQLELDVAVNGSLTEDDGQNFKDGSRVDVLTFRGEAGQSLLLTVDSDQFDTYLVVYGPDGSLLGMNDDAWDNYSSFYQSSLELELYDSGRYTVIVSGYSQWDMGDYSVLLSDASVVNTGHDLESAPSIDVPSSKVITLTEDLPATSQTYAGPGQVLHFSLDEDLLLVVKASSEPVDTVLVLLDADGNEITSNDDYYDDYSVDSYLWQSQLTAQLDAGDYYLVVGSYSGYSTGDVDVSIDAYRPIN